MNVYTGIHSSAGSRTGITALRAKRFPRSEIDLHTRFMYICILDSDGTVVYHKNTPCKPDRFLQAIEPFRHNLVVGVECIFCWHWIADLCEEEGIDFILGHALYMKAIHGVKTMESASDLLGEEGFFLSENAIAF